MKKIIQEPSVWLLIFLVGFPQVSETIYTPSLPELVIMLRATGNQVQETLSVYFLGFALGTLLWGILSDKIGRRPSMLSGILMYILGSVGCLMSDTVDMLLLSRIVQACGAAAGSVVTQTVMRDCYDDARRPHIFAKVSAVLAFSPAVGPLLGSLIAQYYGVKYVFATLVLLGLIAAFFTYFGLNETRPDSSRGKYNIIAVAKRMLFDKHIWLFGSFIGIINGIIFSYYGEAPFIFINHFNFSVVQYGCLGFAIALSSFVGAVVGKKLITCYSYISVMRIGYSAMALGMLLFIVVAGINILVVFQIVGIIIGIFLIMAGIGISLPSCLSNALINYKNSLGIAGALLGLFYYLIVGLSTWGISLLHNNSIITLPLYMLSLTAILMLLTFVLDNKRKE